MKEGVETSSEPKLLLHRGAPSLYSTVGLSHRLGGSTDPTFCLEVKYILGITPSGIGPLLRVVLAPVGDQTKG